MRRKSSPFACALGRCRRQERGFTLIELLVVISIAAVLTAMAVPSMSNLITSQRLRSTAMNLQLTLVHARTEAIKRNVSVAVSPAAGGWGAGWSILDPENPDGPALQVATVPSGLVVSTDAASVVFRANGRTMVGTETSFVFTAGTGASRCVSVANSGRPYAKEGPSC